jgi:hypothetical protein
MRKPIAYQEVDGARRRVDGGYVLLDRRRVGFRVAAYDAQRPLIIDPTLFYMHYSTYLGGGQPDEGYGIAVDGAGNACVIGYTNSQDFPRSNALQPGRRRFRRRVRDEAQRRRNGARLLHLSRRR